MRVDRKQLLATLKDTYTASLGELSDAVGVHPEPLEALIESTGSGEMYAAMIGIKNPDLRVTISVIVDENVVSGAYFQGYADHKGELLDDEIGLFSEFADELTKMSFAKAELSEVSIPPCQIFGGENFCNVPSNKSAVIAFSLGYILGEGRMFINVSVFA